MIGFFAEITIIRISIIDVVMNAFLSFPKVFSLIRLRVTDASVSVLFLVLSLRSVCPRLLVLLWLNLYFDQ